MESEVMTSLVARDTTPLTHVLRPDVRFHSPVTDYQGADDVLHLLGLIALVLDELRVDEELQAGARLVSLFAGRVAEHELDGVLHEVRDADGSVAELTLLLRPFAGATAAITRMGELLADAPLPSRP